MAVAIRFEGAACDCYPMIRDEYRRRLGQEGVQFTMPDSAFQVPATPAAAR